MKRLAAAACTVAVLTTGCGSVGETGQTANTTASTTTESTPTYSEIEQRIRRDALTRYMSSVDKLKDKGVSVDAVTLMSLSDSICPMVEGGSTRKEIEDDFATSQPDVPRNKVAITVDEITSVRCPINDDGLQTISDGINIVGSDIQPGVYRASGSTLGCYWARLSGFTGAGSDIIANDFSSDGQVVVEILPTDKAFKTIDCGVWEKVQ